MWETMVECIQRSAKEVLGIPRGGGGKVKGARWLNEEVKEKVKGKQNAYVVIDSRVDEEKVVNLVEYRARKIAKKVVTIAKNNAFVSLYPKLETKKGKKDVFKLARIRVNKTRDPGNMKCIKGDRSKSYLKDTKIKER